MTVHQLRKKCNAKFSNLGLETQRTVSLAVVLESVEAVVVAAKGLSQQSALYCNRKSWCVAPRRYRELFNKNSVSQFMRRGS